MKIRWLLLVIVVACAKSVFAFQDSTIHSHWKNQPMSIEDNSFIIEEAFNQSPGVIQYTASSQVANDGTAINLECELPLSGERHQLSFSLPTKVSSFTFAVEELMISYRPLVSGRHRWIMITPRLSLIVPTATIEPRLNGGTFGIEWNFALTKRLSRNVISHINLGSTHPLARSHNEPQLNRLHDKFCGASLVLALARNMDLLAEFKATNASGHFASAGTWNLVANPGCRFLFKVTNFVIVPGLSAPIEWRTGLPVARQLLIYLSIERLR
ncbi:MAG TPA: hypothetical protein VGD65_10690 [Chryseosolibacter sp.]